MTHAYRPMFRLFVFSVLREGVCGVWIHSIPVNKATKKKAGHHEDNIWVFLFSLSCYSVCCAPSVSVSLDMRKTKVKRKTWSPINAESIEKHLTEHWSRKKIMLVKEKVNGNFTSFFICLRDYVVCVCI